MWLMLTFAALLLCSCVNTKQRHFSEADAIAVAAREFATHYPDRLLHYTISIADDSEFDQWNVWFHPKGRFADPGGYALIRVNRE
jgi:hypothetical protein